VPQRSGQRPHGVLARAPRPPVARATVPVLLRRPRRAAGGCRGREKGRCLPRRGRARARRVASPWAAGPRPRRPAGMIGRQAFLFRVEELKRRAGWRLRSEEGKRGPRPAAGQPMFAADSAARSGARYRMSISGAAAAACTCGGTGCATGHYSLSLPRSRVAVSAGACSARVWVPRLLLGHVRGLSAARLRRNGREQRESFLCALEYIPEPTPVSRQERNRACCLVYLSFFF